MEKWLAAALDYLPRWLEHQMRSTEQPGVVVAVARAGRLVAEFALGHADATGRVELTPRHRMRVASHSKTFTAAGLLKLREQGRVQLDDPIGRHVRDLHPGVATVTVGQLLSHSAGVIRDGRDAGQWTDRRPYLSEAQIRDDLADGPVLEPNTRFKYSNHGFALAGLAIESITGEPYREWIAREIVAACGLRETQPDAPLSGEQPFARGHSGKLPLGHRVLIPGDNVTGTLAPATGFISTAADLARFFGSLSPGARRSVLSVASRREMTRRQWLEAHSSLGRWYGLGTISGTLGDWDWFGHSGAFQGYLTRTVVLPAQDLSLSVLTNAIDGLSGPWLDGCLHILRAFARHGAASRATAPWHGRWWSLWGAWDLLPMADRVLIAAPGLLNPMLDASEIALRPGVRGGTREGLIALAGSFGNHGEPARLMRDGDGRPSEFWLSGTRLLPQDTLMQEMAARYR